MIFEDLLPYILPHVKGCAEVTATFNARLAVIELCRKAMVWREYQDPIDVTAGVKFSPYAPAVGQQIVKLLSLTLDGVDLPVVTPDKGKLLDRQGSGQRYAYANMSGVEIRPAPAADAEIITYCVVAPSLTAEEIPDDFGRFAEAIARGAAYRLMLTKGKDYSDANLGLLLKAEWESEIGEANSEAYRGMARMATPLRTVSQWM